MLLSGAGAEGTDLRNVMSIHIMEPYWNYGRIQQIIARAVRYKSHTDYPENERIVQPYIYLSDYPKSFEFKPTKYKKIPESTTDVHLYKKSLKGKRLIDRMYATMIEASIDCPLHIRNSPQEVKDKIKCLMCTPTHSQLFHPNVDTDLKIANPCIPPSTESVQADELEYQGQKFYYTTDSSGNISIYEYQKNLDAYVKMDRAHPFYEAMITQLNA